MDSCGDLSVFRAREGFVALADRGPRDPGDNGKSGAECELSEGDVEPVVDGLIGGDFVVTAA
jgi:hypothetical protein